MTSYANNQHKDAEMALLESEKQISKNKKIT